MVRFNVPTLNNPLYDVGFMDCTYHFIVPTLFTPNKSSEIQKYIHVVLTIIKTQSVSKKSTNCIQLRSPDETRKVPIYDPPGSPERRAISSPRPTRRAGCGCDRWDSAWKTISETGLGRFYGGFMANVHDFWHFCSKKGLWLFHLWIWYVGKKRWAKTIHIITIDPNQWVQ